VFEMCTTTKICLTVSLSQREALQIVSSARVATFAQMDNKPDRATLHSCTTDNANLVKFILGH
jgi:hypothetical protein